MTDQDPRTGEIMDEGSMADRDMLSAQLASLWWTFLLRGVLAGAVGIAALFWPSGSIALLLRLVGALLILDGALTLFGVGRRGLLGGAAIGGVLIGLILMIWPEGTVKLAFFLLGAWALIIGIGSLAAAGQMHERDPQRGSMRGSGFAALIVGLVLMIWPAIALVALGWAIAFSALAISAVMVWLAIRFRNAKSRVGLKTVNR